MNCLPIVLSIYHTHRITTHPWYRNSIHKHWRRNSTSFTRIDSRKPYLRSLLLDPHSSHWHGICCVIFLLYLEMVKVVCYMNERINLCVGRCGLFTALSWNDIPNLIYHFAFISNKFSLEGTRTISTCKWITTRRNYTTTTWMLSLHTSIMIP